MLKMAGFTYVFQSVGSEAILKYKSQHACAIADFFDNGVRMKNKRK